MELSTARNTQRTTPLSLEEIHTPQGTANITFAGGSDHPDGNFAMGWLQPNFMNPTLFKTGRPELADIDALCQELDRRNIKLLLLGSTATRAIDLSITQAVSDKLKQLHRADIEVVLVKNGNLYDQTLEVRLSTNERMTAGTEFIRPSKYFS